MTESETLQTVGQAYREHYIQICVKASPPLPHDDDSGSVVAYVALHDAETGRVNRLFGNDVAGDVIDTWYTEVPLYDSADTLTELIESAKKRVDDRVAQRTGVSESLTIACERAFPLYDDE